MVRLLSITIGVVDFLVDMPLLTVKYRLCRTFSLFFLGFLIYEVAHFLLDGVI